MTILSAIKTLSSVERVNEWNGRCYVTLRAVRGSRANADLRTKIWLKDDVLTIEAGKGYCSDAFIAAKGELVTAVETAGGSVREI